MIAIDCSLCPVARKQHSGCNGIKDAWIRACSSLESYLVYNFQTWGKCKNRLLDRVSWACNSNVQEVMFKWCSAGSE